MAETTPPSSTEKTVAADNHSHCKLWTFTIISLTLNVVILVFILVGAIIHHHHMHPHFAGQTAGAYMNAPGQFGGGPQMQRFAGPGWTAQAGSNGFASAGAGGPLPGMGMRGMMGGTGMMAPGPDGKPDPARATDMLLNLLSNKLALTDDEKAKIKPIIEAQVAQTQKEMEAQRAARQKEMDDTKAKIKPLLTPDQQKQLDAIPLPGQKPPMLPVPADAKPPGPPPE